MIKAVITKTKDGEYKSFSCDGHAGYADKGKDIICAATSILVINTINAIEKFSDSEILIEEKPVLKMTFVSVPDEKAKVLMDALVLGIDGIRNDNGKRYLKLVFEEV